MSTYVGVRAIVGFPLREHLTSKVIETQYTRYNERTGEPYTVDREEFVYTFEGKEYSIYESQMCDPTEEYKSPLQVAMEKSLGFPVYYPEGYPEDGYYGKLVGKEDDQGMVVDDQGTGVVSSSITEGELHDAFAELQEKIGRWPKLHLMSYTY